MERGGSNEDASSPEPPSKSDGRSISGARRGAVSLITSIGFLILCALDKAQINVNIWF